MFVNPKLFDADEIDSEYKSNPAALNIEIVFDDIIYAENPSIILT